MRIFKNRGDIYISKSSYKGSKEERILIVLLAMIVVITVAFVVLLSQKYHTVSDFFAEGEISTTVEGEGDEMALPKIEGKTNYLFFETDDEETTIHYAFLIQADKSELAYKVATIAPNTMIDDKSLFEIYSEGGGASLQTKLTEYFGIEIDYYAQFRNTQFVDFAKRMGSFVYPVGEEIKYTGGTGDDTYTLHMKEGEQTLGGKQLADILRYYCNDKVNYSAANEVILYALTGLFNEDNYEDVDYFFRTFISNCTTNITVRDFQNGKDAIMVFALRNMDVTVYSSIPSYEKNVMTAQSSNEIKGYFSKG